MAKKSKKDFEFKPFESTTRTAKHLRITNNMLESAAWKKLSCHAMVIYMYMKSKYNFNNENDISLTYAEGQKLMHKNTFTKAIDELIEYGFIKVIRQSWTSRECNIYGFSSMWQKYGTPEFKIDPRRKRDSTATKNKKARLKIAHQVG
jgi:hypothetical protein